MFKLRSMTMFNPVVSVLPFRRGTAARLVGLGRRMLSMAAILVIADIGLRWRRSTIHLAASASHGDEWVVVEGEPFVRSVCQAAQSDFL